MFFLHKECPERATVEVKSREAVLNMQSTDAVRSLREQQVRDEKFSQATSRNPLLLIAEKFLKAWKLSAFRTKCSYYVL
jgi:hypothetical protein